MSEELLNKQIELTVVGRRCVYLNDFRIAGGKPYVSENLPQHSFTIRIADLIQAVPELALRARAAQGDQS